MKTRSFLSTPARFSALLAVLTAALLMLAGCFGGDSVDEAAEQEASVSKSAAAESGSEAENPLQAMSEMGKKMEEGKNRTIEPVDFRTLRALLPETAGGLERTEMEGQKGGTMGMTISTTEATYEGEAGRRLTVKIADLGGVSGFAMLGYGWAMADIDRESTSGYEKTTQYDGHKAHEKYNRDRQRGEMQVLVADRFVVDVSGRDVEMETVKDALAQIDLSTLVAMKDEGVQDDT